MKRHVPHAFLLLAIGFAGGLCVPRSPSPPAEGGSHPATAKSPRPEVAADRGRKSAALREDIRRMANTEDFGARVEFTRRLGGKDAPDLLAVLQEEATPLGISHHLKEMLDTALAKWADEDVDTALAWAATEATPETRRYLQKELLGKFAATDPFRAVELALGIQRNDPEFEALGITSSGVSALCKTAGSEAKVLELLRKTAVQGASPTCGSGQDFAKGFSPEALLDGLAAMKQEGLSPQWVPIGMLQEWAKQDPDAAHAWFAGHGVVALEEWDGIFVSVAASTGPQAAGQWFAEKFGQADSSVRDAMITGFSKAHYDAGDLTLRADAVARQMEPEDAAGFIDKVYRLRGLGTWPLLAWYPTPEARADAMIAEAGNVDLILKRVPEFNLAEFGVNRALLESAVQRRKAGDSE